MNNFRSGQLNGLEDGKDVLDNLESETHSADRKEPEIEKVSLPNFWPVFLSEFLNGMYSDPVFLQIWIHLYHLYTPGAAASIHADESELSCHSHSRVRGFMSFRS